MGAYNDDVLFIHIPKTGGWSVKKYMEEHLPGVLMPDNPASRLPIGHVRLADIERFTGRAPQSFRLILAVVRNPFEQQISQACFWAKRYLTGGRHVHDVNTWRHVYAERVQERIERCVWSSEVFQFQPGDINLLGFVSDPRCDFHVWYQAHWGYYPGQPADEQQALRKTDQPAPPDRNRYDQHGGLYRYWLMVDGEIPPNVCVVKLEELDETVPALLQPFADHPLPPLPRLNTSPHEESWQAWIDAEIYPEITALVIAQKFRWAFSEHYFFPKKYALAVWIWMESLLKAES